MAQYMAISTFFENTDMSEVLQVVAEERAKVQELQEQGRLGQIRLAVPKGKVFLDVFAESDEEAISVVRELPMAKWWDVEVFPLSGMA